VSQVQKACRRGQEETAIWFALELDQSGYSPWIWRRLLVIASEDVGIASTETVLLVHSLYRLWKEERAKDKKAQGGLFLTHAVLALARAPKSRVADSAYMALSDAPPRQVDDVALDRHTREGRRRGRGWAHFFEESGLLADPETGELTEDGATPDPYRERARAVLERGERQGLPGTVAERIEQLRLEDNEGSD
jgi:hypothetical protein